MGTRFDVPVTGAFLSFVAALQAAKEMYLYEGMLAHDLGFDSPGNWYDRSYALFVKNYHRHAEAIGLSVDEVTFRSLLGLVIPEDAKAIPAKDLPGAYVFDPKRGIRKTGSGQDLADGMVATA